MTVEAAYRAIVEAEVELLVGVPDSLLAPLHRHAAAHAEVEYLPVCDEATAVGVAAGARLAGRRSMVLMESSGLRRACETLSRFVLAHRLHTLLLLARRGALGERNWWGLAHEETMGPHLESLRLLRQELDSGDIFADVLRAGFASLDTGQRSVALIANRGFTESLVAS